MEKRFCVQTRLIACPWLSYTRVNVVNQKFGVLFQDNGRKNCGTFHVKNYIFIKRDSELFILVPFNNSIMFLLVVVFV